jgi:hypothetical protein
MYLDVEFTTLTPPSAPQESHPTQSQNREAVFQWYKLQGSPNILPPCSQTASQSRTATNPIGVTLPTKSTMWISQNQISGFWIIKGRLVMRAGSK